MAPVFTVVDEHVASVECFGAASRGTLEFSIVLVSFDVVLQVLFGLDLLLAYMAFKPSRLRMSHLVLVKISPVGQPFAAGLSCLGINEVTDRIVDSLFGHIF